MIQTATDQFSSRHKARNGTCRNQAGSRISTAGAADTGKGQLVFSNEFPEHLTNEADSKGDAASKINYVEYPVAPTQPMLTDRASLRPLATHLPSSLQQSPDRDDIILFAPLQTSPPNSGARNADSCSRTFDSGAQNNPFADKGMATMDSN